MSYNFRSFSKLFFAKMRKLNNDWKIADFGKEMVQILALFHVTTHYVFSGTLCIGPSMLPTLQEKGDFVIVDKFSYALRRHAYSKGDVVISICPYDANKTICKRVAATAGESVRVDAWGYRERVVPPGHVWLAGDNASNSLDSRRYGAVPEGLLLGKVIFKINTNYPFISRLQNFIHGDTPKDSNNSGCTTAEGTARSDNAPVACESTSAATASASRAIIAESATAATATSSLESTHNISDEKPST